LASELPPRDGGIQYPLILRTNNIKLRAPGLITYGQDEIRDVIDPRCLRLGDVIHMKEKWRVFLMNPSPYPSSPTSMGVQLAFTQSP
jgi:hypothetical protein